MFIVRSSMAQDEAQMHSESPKFVKRAYVASISANYYLPVRTIISVVGDINIAHKTAQALAASLHLNCFSQRCNGPWVEAASCTADAPWPSLLRLCLSTPVTIVVSQNAAALPVLQRALRDAPAKAGCPTWHALVFFTQHALSSGAFSGSQVCDLLKAALPTAVSGLARWCAGACPASEQEACSEVRAKQNVDSHTQPTVVFANVVAIAIPHLLVERLVFDTHNTAGILSDSTRAKARAANDHRFSASSCGPS
jgi:hypothetical protein